MKVGSLVSMYIALDPRGIDIAYPAKFKTHSEERGIGVSLRL